MHFSSYPPFNSSIFPSSNKINVQSFSSDTNDEHFLIFDVFFILKV